MSFLSVCKALSLHVLLKLHIYTVEHFVELYISYIIEYDLDLNLVRSAGFNLNWIHLSIKCSMKALRKAKAKLNKCYRQFIYGSFVYVLSKMDENLYAQSHLKLSVLSICIKLLHVFSPVDMHKVS